MFLKRVKLNSKAVRLYRRQRTAGSQMAWKKMLGGLEIEKKGGSQGRYGWVGRRVGSWTFGYHEAPPPMWARGGLVRGAQNQIPDLSALVVRCLCLRCPATDANYSFLSLFYGLVGRMIKARHGNPFLNFAGSRNKRATLREIVIYETYETRRY